MYVNGIPLTSPAAGCRVDVRFAMAPAGDVFRLQYLAGVTRVDLKVRTNTHMSGAEAISSRRSICLASGAAAEHADVPAAV